MTVCRHDKAVISRCQLIRSAPLYSKISKTKIMVKDGSVIFLLSQNLTSLNILNIPRNESVTVRGFHSQMLHMFLSIILPNFRLHILAKLDKKHIDLYFPEGFHHGLVKMFQTVCEFFFHLLTRKNIVL